MPVTEPLFQQDAYLGTCTAAVAEAGETGVVLDRTVFYPLGAGQPGDTGVLKPADGREWRVVDARKGARVRFRLHLHEDARRMDRRPLGDQRHQDVHHPG